MAHGDKPQLPLDAPAELPIPPLPRPPFWMVAIALVGITGTWLPLALIARARVTRGTEPRVQLAQDMGVMPKMMVQMDNPSYADDREMRPAIVGTVEWNHLDENENYIHGFTLVNTTAATRPSPDYVKSVSDVVTVDKKLVERGQNRFNIYCFICHGYDGSGNGAVNYDAMKLMSDGVSGMTWTQAIAIATDAKVKAETDGQIFNTITNGIRTMPGYGGQVPVADRWAIVAYLRALQFSQAAPLSAASADQQKRLNEQ